MIELDRFVYEIPLATAFRGITVRHGMLLEGPAGWGDFCPFVEYDDHESAAWLATAIEAATLGWPTPVRDTVPVNVIVPAVGPERAFELVRASGCSTAKVKVADRANAGVSASSAGWDPSRSAAADQARVEAVRAALGPSGRIRVDANAVWDVGTAAARLAELDRVAGGLEYAEQPCATLDELAQLRRRIDIPIAADESIRKASDPLAVALAGAADYAVIKATPLGGVRRSLEVAQACGLPCVVSSALETSVGLAAQLALAAALPSLENACGLGTLALFTRDVVADSLLPVQGSLAVRSPRPDPALLAQLRPADPAVERWWNDRYERVLALL